MTDSPSNNRREYYRIDDDIEFSYYALSAQTLADQIKEHVLKQHLFSDESAYQHFRLLQESRAAHDSMESSFRRIQLQMPELANYLEMMEHNFNTITHAIFRAYDRPTQRVSISVGGLGFWINEPLPLEQGLKVKVILRPSFDGFIGTGKVVGCLHQPHALSDTPYRISMQFINLPEGIQQRLNRHIIYLQLHARRQEDEHDQGNSMTKRDA